MSPLYPFSSYTKAGDRVALALSYDGHAYRGWQSQRKPIVPTVQDALQQALSFVAATDITVQCAGRTDSGVHASHQVVHFDTPVDRAEKAWVMGCNTQLPKDVAVHWAKPVTPDFNARFSATARRYRYIILNTPARNAVLPYGVTLETMPLNECAMHEAAQSLLGEQDFTSYRAVACQSKTAMRNIHCVTVERRNELVIIDIQANAFLYHMVRNITGVLLEIGRGKRPISWVNELLAVKDRAAAAATAPPHGLYMVDVAYPDIYGLPEAIVGPYFLS
ncbi:tRNA pseudouridine(38-40) synthase TruA [bacterium]|nr:tRNA pseudouridine(38-40) synthase TruA [bacterium]